MPLVATDDELVSLERMTGVLAVDAAAGTAEVLPGTPMDELGAQLVERGVAIDNYGDVDYQAIAGAIGTGTHGSGARLGNLSSILVGGTLVTGTGEAVRFTRDGHDASADLGQDALLPAAQVSLGALGIFTSLTLRVRPAYELHRTNWMTHIDWVLEHFHELVEANRCFDFYWYPRSDLAQVRMLNEPGDEPGIRPPGELRREETGPSYEILPNDRHLRFEEMEHMLPLDPELRAFREVRERVKAKHRTRVGWRVLVRTIAADDAMLSGAQGRPTMTIALLHNASLPHEHYFGDMEPLLLEHGGRPHWGKKHTMRAAQLAPLYLRWNEFARVREALDPDGVLRNEHLSELLIGSSEGA